MPAPNLFLADNTLAKEMQEIQKELNSMVGEHARQKKSPAKQEGELSRYALSTKRSLLAQCLIINRAMSWTPPESGEGFVYDGIPCATDYSDIAYRSLPYSQWDIPRDAMLGETSHCRIACTSDLIANKYIPLYEGVLAKHQYAPGNHEYNPSYHNFLKQIGQYINMYENSVMFNGIPEKHRRESKDYLRTILEDILFTRWPCVWMQRGILNLLTEHRIIEQDFDFHPTYLPRLKDLADKLNNFLGEDCPEEQRFYDDFYPKWHNSEKTEKEEEESQNNMEKFREMVIDKMVKIFEKLNIRKEIEDYCKLVYPLYSEEINESPKRRLGCDSGRHWMLHPDPHGQYIKDSDKFLRSMRNNDEFFIRLEHPFHSVNRHQLPHIIKIRCKVIENKKYFELFDPLSGWRIYTEKDLISHLKNKASQYAESAKYAHLSLVVIPASAVEKFGGMFNEILKERHKSGLLVTLSEYLTEKQKQPPRHGGTQSTEPSTGTRTNTEEVIQKKSETRSMLSLIRDLLNHIPHYIWKVLSFIIFCPGKNPRNNAENYESYRQQLEKQPEQSAHNADTVPPSDVSTDMTVNSASSPQTRRPVTHR